MRFSLKLLRHRHPAEERDPRQAAQTLRMSGVDPALRRGSRNGFTLVELSIVLVIIGLIIGGVLVGRELIYAANIRKTISQKEKFDTAANTFKIKYNCLPGDCASASQFGFGSGSTVGGFTSGNGNGDGMVCQPVVEYSQNLAECLNFWHHLLAAELVNYTLPGFTDTTPSFFPGWHSPHPPILKQKTYGVFNSGSSAGDKPRGGWAVLDAQAITGIADGRSGLTFTPPFIARSYMLLANTNFRDPQRESGVTPNDMRMVDQKIDDGKPLTGAVFAVYGEMRHETISSSSTFSKPHATTWDAQYPNSDTIGWYNLVMKAGF